MRYSPRVEGSEGEKFPDARRRITPWPSMLPIACLDSAFAGKSAGGQHRSVDAEILFLPSYHQRNFRAALVSDIPNSLQPFSSVRVEVIELIEQECARASSEKPLDHCSGAKDLSV